MILSCSHIDKAFGAKNILKDVSFHVEEREKAAIVGINGAGKSTLLKIIMKQLSADKGQASDILPSMRLYPVSILFMKSFWK